MTHDLRDAITHEHDRLAAFPVRLETDAEHQLRARMKRFRELLNWADGYGPDLRLSAGDRFEVIDGDNNGRVEPMGTMGLELTGFRDDFTLEGLRAVLVCLLGEVDGRIRRGER